MLKEILNFVFPMSCVACGDEEAEDSVQLCSSCALLIPKELRQLKPSSLLEERWSLASYESPVGAALRKAKFGTDLVLMLRLADVLCEGVNNSTFEDVDVVTHIPTSLGRELLRGFDQAEILAQAVSKKLNLPHARLLSRQDPSEQSVKSWEERLDYRGRFQAIQSRSRVLIVDDVCTSGATLEAAAQELLLNGAQKVKALSLLSRQI